MAMVGLRPSDSPGSQRDIHEFGNGLTRVSLLFETPGEQMMVLWTVQAAKS